MNTKRMQAWTDEGQTIIDEAKEPEPAKAVRCFEHIGVRGSDVCIWRVNMQTGSGDWTRLNGASGHDVDGYFARPIRQWVDYIRDGWREITEAQYNAKADAIRKTAESKKDASTPKPPTPEKWPKFLYLESSGWIGEYSSESKVTYHHKDKSRKGDGRSTSGRWSAPNRGLYIELTSEQAKAILAEWGKESTPKPPTPWTAESFPKDRPVWVRRKGKSEDRCVMITRVSRVNLGFRSRRGMMVDDHSIPYGELLANYVQHNGSPCGPVNQ